MAAETREFKDIYREADAEERFTLMMDNYNAFPKIIRKMERKTKYRIVTEHERMRSAHRDELGVRIQTSGLSDPTAAEAEADMLLDEAFKTGKIDISICRGLENGEVYRADILIISRMKRDFELLVGIIEDLDDEDNSQCIKEYLEKQKLMKELADDRGRSYEAIKKRIEKIRADIRKEMLGCLEM